MSLFKNTSFARPEGLFMEGRPSVWSCGGGTQSAAIAALIVKGQLPKPDYSLIVDTERERSATWDYFARTLQPALAAVGVDLVRVPKSAHATVDLYGGNGDLLLPAFTATGKLPTFCSNEWKRRVVKRYLAANGVKRCVLWLGMSAEESKRVRISSESWAVHAFPLFDMWLTRQDCIDLVTSMGWPPPPRSSCWMCPNMGPDEWTSLPPADLEKACALEDEIRAKDANLYLHPTRKPLREADLGASNGEETGCLHGVCFV